MTAPVRHCTYCLLKEPDVCVRVQPPKQGGAHVYAHSNCAQSRGVRPLYRFTDEPTARAQ